MDCCAILGESMTMRTSNKSVLAPLGVLASAAALGAGQATAAETQDTELEEVVITAELRSVSVQDVPLSAVAFSGDALEQRGVKTFDELQYQVPSLNFTDNGNSKFVNIRGVGVSEAAPNQTVGVAVHLDGAYVAREFVYGDALFDLDSVEVLRGPQGTYSGQNAAGGSIFINSKKPVIGRTDGFINAELSDYDGRRLGAGATLTLSDRLALRIAGDIEERGSFYNNHGVDPTTPARLIEDQPGNLNRSLARLQLLYQATDDLELRVIHERSDVRSDGVPYQVFPVRGTNTLPDSDRRELYFDLDGHRNVKYERTTGKIDWQALPSVKVLSTVSYLKSHQHFFQDLDRNTFVAPDTVQNGADYTINDHYWTAEVNLVSTLDGPFEWTLGASHLDYEQNNFLNFLRYNNAQFPGTAVDVQRHTRLYFFLNNLRKNSAIFGELGYQLTPTLQVKAGLRYNDDKVGFSDQSYSSGGPVYPAGRLSHYFAPTGAPTPAEMQDFTETTGRVLLNWKPVEDQMVYGTVSRGYKPGGTTPLADTYDAEKVTNYELGWKGDLGQTGITGSVAVYYMDYQGFQRTYAPDPNNPASAVTNNVDGTTIKGIEAQLSGRLGMFRWDASYAYNKGTYGDLVVALPAGIIDGVNPPVAESFNLKGQAVDYLPRSVWNLGLSYTGLRVGAGTLVPSLRVTHQDKFYSTFYHFDYNLTPGKTLLDASIAYESDTDWRAELYARNLADKTYISRAQGGSDANGQYLLGNPRQVGFKVGYRF